MKKKGTLKKIAALCMVAFIGITTAATPGWAKNPTDNTKASTLTLGKNTIKICNYDDDTDTLIGCFTAPETGKYKIKVVNVGSESFYCNILDSNLQTKWYLGGNDGYMNCNEGGEDIWTLKKNEKIYTYMDSYDADIAAAKVNIQKVVPTVKLNRTAMSLKIKSSKTLKLVNSKKSVIWVSKNKKIATVSSKGKVKAKKKGTTYIYAISNDKLYKCKVSVYK